MRWPILMAWLASASAISAHADTYTCASPTVVRINQIYNPQQGNTAGYIELFVTSATPVNMENWRICYSTVHKDECVPIGTGKGEVYSAAGTYLGNDGNASAVGPGYFVVFDETRFGDANTFGQSMGEALLLNNADPRLGVHYVRYSNTGAETWKYAVSGSCMTNYIQPNANNYGICSYTSDGYLPAADWALNCADTRGSSNREAAPAPASFNAFETATAAGAITGVIHTKVAGTAFSLDLVAINAAKTGQETGFSGDVAVDLVANVNPGTGLDANNCPVSGSAIAVGTRSIAGGRSTAAFPAVAEAWRDVRVRIRYPASAPTLTACSSDNFAIRPAYLAPLASDTNWETAGTSRTLDQTGATGTVFHKAGRPFTLRATAYNAANAITAQYAGGPVGGIAACVLPTSGCVTGSLDVGSWSASAGTLTSDTARYSEVGAISARLTDTNFAVVDAADGSTAAERSIESPAFDVGRFVPDHFAIAPGTVTHRADIPGCLGSTFTYLGEDFATAFTLTAQNAANATTLNYTGALAKLDLAAWANYAFSATGLPTGSTLQAGTNAPTGTWLNGVAAVIAQHQASRPATPVAAANVTVSAAPKDGDGVTMTATAVAAAVPVRFGRLWCGNAFGSDRADLAMPYQAQQWNGLAFVANADDNCSGLAAGNLALGNAQGGIASSVKAVAFANGTGSVTLASPGKGGSIDVAFNLGAGTAPQMCPTWTPPASTGAKRGYLRGKWCGTAYDKDPVCRATFGVYGSSGKKGVIYLREGY